MCPVKVPEYQYKVPWHPRIYDSLLAGNGTVLTFISGIVLTFISEYASKIGIAHCGEVNVDEGEEGRLLPGRWSTPSGVCRNFQFGTQIFAKTYHKSLKYIYLCPPITCSVQKYYEDQKIYPGDSRTYHIDHHLGQRTEGCPQDQSLVRCHNHG